MHSILTAQDVTFEFPNGRELFSELNFSLESRLTALVGPNGVGKTTLARLLCGELEPTHGKIRRHGAVLYFPQRQAQPQISVAEYIAEVPWSPLRESLLQGISDESLCTTLSGGEWMRVRLARTLDDSYLILDEPTNDLDRQGREALLQFLSQRRGGALLISHDRECLSLCSDILELSNQGLAKFGGGWEAYTDAKELERGNLNRALDLAKRQRDSTARERRENMDRQEKRNRRGQQAADRGGMPKILIGARKRRAQGTTGKVDSETLQRAQTAVRDAHEALTDLKIDPIMYADLVGTEIPAQKLVMEARAFNIRFRDWLYPQDLNFVWRGNIRIALKGANGSGKSTLLKALLGQKFETRGELRRGEMTSLYVDQRCALLDDEKSVLENIQAVATLDESEIRNGLARFLFMKDSVFQKAKDLSGGERLRATLARGFLSAQKPELLILDEPTNNLDLGNIEFLENLVRAFRGALIVISHDPHFLENCDVKEEIQLG